MVFGGYCERMIYVQRVWRFIVYNLVVYIGHPTRIDPGGGGSRPLSTIHLDVINRQPD